ncbi:hypothetical protein AAFF_G00389230 [Aldrovandia affinis]|uniref:Uncharacterized protein n=1 Tax=Aldrovandia affinis TaxID=143900 RepID=A0AAD7SEB3_9TELE|nr:hypothetical protein AAFF_G00389230 [Aldrovandia affinis]
MLAPKRACGGRTGLALASRNGQQHHNPPPICTLAGCDAQGVLWFRPTGGSVPLLVQENRTGRDVWGVGGAPSAWGSGGRGPGLSEPTWGRQIDLKEDRGLAALIAATMASPDELLM